jgi:hypothetical protein
MSACHHCWSDVPGGSRAQTAMEFLDNSDVLQTLPQDGDVLVARAGATGQYSVAVVPEHPHLQYERRSRAMEGAWRLARDRAVDAWLTEDLIHFGRLAHFRE